MDDEVEVNIEIDEEALAAALRKALEPVLETMIAEIRRIARQIDNEGEEWKQGRREEE